MTRSTERDRRLGIPALKHTSAALCNPAGDRLQEFQDLIRHHASRRQVLTGYVQRDGRALRRCSRSHPSNVKRLQGRRTKRSRRVADRNKRAIVSILTRTERENVPRVHISQAHTLCSEFSMRRQPTPRPRRRTSATRRLPTSNRLRRRSWRTVHRFGRHVSRPNAAKELSVYKHASRG